MGSEPSDQATLSQGDLLDPTLLAELTSPPSLFGFAHHPGYQQCALANPVAPGLLRSPLRKGCETCGRASHAHAAPPVEQCWRFAHVSPSEASSCDRLLHISCVGQPPEVFHHYQNRPSSAKPALSESEALIHQVTMSELPCGAVSRDRTQHMTPSSALGPDLPLLSFSSLQRIVGGEAVEA